jgi:hypothetical protein
MNKIMLIAFTLTSVTTIATENLPKQCKNTEINASYIDQKIVRGHHVNIVHIFGESARELYFQIYSDETVITENGVDFVIKTQENTEISCVREVKIKQNRCTNYECVI